jgi:LPS-assembly protein
LIVTILCSLVLATQASAQVLTLPPDRRILVSRPDAPPKGDWNISATKEESEGKLYKLHGKAEVEGATMLMRGDEITFNKDTGDLHADGHVYFHQFERAEELWADHVDYNTQSETGKFYNVSGQAPGHVDTRPGMLSTTSPFIFEGEWAERLEDHYVLHNGFITDCRMPNPWWRLRGPKFDIVPGDHATAYSSTFFLRKMPLFFTPYFYKSLQKNPRRSGFMLPSFGNSSLAGKFFDAGFFWAINRSYDITYRFTDYTARGTAHNVDLRGKPRKGTDYDAIIYGVQDRGLYPGTADPQAYGGVSLNIAGKSDLGDGWYARGQLSYLSSFDFREVWSQSFADAIGTESHSVGYVGKNWSDYTFNVVADRMENFQGLEVQITDPVTGVSKLETNAITIRKLPEAEFSEREHQIWQSVPLWFSFESAAGLLYREEPIFDSTDTVLLDRFQTGQAVTRFNLAPHVMTTLHWGAFHIVPRFGIQETFYSESQALGPDGFFQALNTDLLRSSRDVSVDFIFPSLARLFPKKSFLGDKAKHVIEPRATYKYVNGIGDDFSRYIRFDETDLVSNTNELDLSLTNRLYAKRGDQVKEIVFWEVAQNRYFDPTFGGALVPGQRNVFLTTDELTPYAFLDGPRVESPVVSIFRITPFSGPGIEWRTDYDPTRREIVNSTVSVDYRWNQYFVSVGHNQVHTDPLLNEPVDQFHFRVGVGDPNHRGWNAGIDSVYDLRQHYLQYATVQVTYNTDCCGLSVEWRRFDFGLRDESSFRVAFSIANLGSFGNLRRQDRVF